MKLASKTYYFLCFFDDFQWFSMISAPARPAAGRGPEPTTYVAILLILRVIIFGSFLDPNLQLQTLAISRLFGVRRCGWVRWKATYLKFPFLAFLERQGHPQKRQPRGSKKNNFFWCFFSKTRLNSQSKSARKSSQKVDFSQKFSRLSNLNIVMTHKTCGGSPASLETV